eukprot:SAG11_NODE_687_length_7719_cov_1.975328_2_plen_479_part_00
MSHSTAAATHIGAVWRGAAVRLRTRQQRAADHKEAELSKAEVGRLAAAAAEATRRQLSVLHHLQAPPKPKRADFAAKSAATRAALEREATNGATPTLEETARRARLRRIAFLQQVAAETVMAEKAAAVVSAATRIQARYRGFSKRKEGAALKAQSDITNKEHESAARIQAQYRGAAARHQYVKARVAHVAETQGQQEQAKLVAELEATVVEQSAAVLIQTRYRGFAARHGLESVLKTEECAGQHSDDCNEFDSVDEEEAFETENATEDKHIAAVLIQARYRGFKARQRTLPQALEPAEEPAKELAEEPSEETPERNPRHMAIRRVAFLREAARAPNFGARVNGAQSTTSASSNSSSSSVASGAARRALRLMSHEFFIDKNIVVRSASTTKPSLTLCATARLERANCVHLCLQANAAKTPRTPKAAGAGTKPLKLATAVPETADLVGVAPAAHCSPLPRSSSRSDETTPLGRLDRNELS